MAFRQSRKDHHQPREWQDWIEFRRQELVAIGLPPEVYLDQSRWTDFLENGHLHWHESSGFEFADLNRGQLAALLRFMEREYGGSEMRCPLLDYLRVRLAAGG
jgi:hypothetical protein